jgi:hypothetical protein
MHQDPRRTPNIQHDNAPATSCSSVLVQPIGNSILILPLCKIKRELICEGGSGNESADVNDARSGLDAAVDSRSDLGSNIGGASFFDSVAGASGKVVGDIDVVPSASSCTTFTGTKTDLFFSLLRHL